jgi:hypothetical protein
MDKELQHVAIYIHISAMLQTELPKTRKNLQ